MPYKSQAQRRLFHWLESQGKLSPQKVHEWDVASKGKKLPEKVKQRKAFGGEVHAVEGTHCPACDLPLDSAPVAMDAGEGCPRCGYGSAKQVPKKARGGEIMEPTTYRGRGGEIKCAHCGEVMHVPNKAHGGMMSDVDEYVHKKTAHVDDGKPKQGFAKALKGRK